MTEIDAILSVYETIKNFNWSGYGLDVVSEGIREDLAAQDWLVDLANEIFSSIETYIQGN
jgi:hypothetical protein